MTDKQVYDECIAGPYNGYKVSWKKEMRQVGDNLDLNTMDDEKISVARKILSKAVRDERERVKNIKWNKMMGQNIDGNENNIDTRNTVVQNVCLALVKRLHRQIMLTKNENEDLVNEKPWSDIPWKELDKDRKPPEKNMSVMR